MKLHDENNDLEMTQEQIDLLTQLGVAEGDLQGMSFEEAEELIREMQARREDAGKIGRD